MDIADRYFTTPPGCGGAATRNYFWRVKNRVIGQSGSIFIRLFQEASARLL